jgi:gluconokinase
MIVLVMGVSGSGKSTIGQALAETMGADFLEADSFHSSANVDKMARGIPLEDSDRWPWLEAIGRALDHAIAREKRVVLACSALKQAYRDRLLGKAGRCGVTVFLNGDPSLIAARMSGRQGHYMPAALLPSQLATLEPPEDAIVVDIAKSPDAILGEIRAALGK